MEQSASTDYEHPSEDTMSRTFLYARVSTVEQTTMNQVAEVAAAGFNVDSKRIVEECVSGSVPAGQRPGFAKLIDRLEAGDVLLVTKLDRLGRNAIDVQQTVQRLDVIGVRVHCLALGGVDLSSPAGKMTMAVITAVAEFERDLIIERTHAGLARAKADGKTPGLKHTLTSDQRAAIKERIEVGATISGLAREFSTSRATIWRIASEQGAGI